MNILLKIVLSTIAIMVAAYIVPGVTVKDYLTALVVAIVLGVLYAVLRPLLVLLTLPATVLTFGLFLFVINAVMVLLAARLVPGFGVVGFWTAMLFSVVVSLIGGLFNMLDGSGQKA